MPSPAGLVNESLNRIGSTDRIGNLYDGSKAAKVALNIYAQTRDDILRNSDFGFTRKEVSLTLLKQAPDVYLTGWDPNNHPPLPWRFEYAYPDDCLRAGGIKDTPIFATDFAPRARSFTETIDGYLAPPRRVVLCNIPGAVLTYTARITDLNLWDAGALEAFIAALGRRLAPALASPQIAQAEAQDEQAQAQASNAIQG